MLPQNAFGNVGGVGEQNETEGSCWRSQHREHRLEKRDEGIVLAFE